MDIIKLYSTTSIPTELSAGQVISGWSTFLWVERWQNAGEFKIEAPMSSGLRELLPIGSFVTHRESKEVMMVEDHGIKQPKDEDGKIVITGRSLLAFAEQRIIGDGPASSTNTRGEYITPAALTWVQLVTLINAHMINADDPDNDLPGVDVSHICTGSGTSEARNLQYDEVYPRLIEIMKIDDVSVRVERPTPTDPITHFIVYQGVDRTADVRFSWVAGDLDDIEYFFSNRKKKNVARVVGRWVQVIVEDGSPEGIDRRSMVVEASDMDSPQPSMPTGMALTWIVAAMEIRGREALASQRDISITTVDVSEVARQRYRHDYDIGDLVTVHGDFETSQVMRVTEFAETADENGVRGHPTLSIPGEN